MPTFEVTTGFNPDSAAPGAVKANVVNIDADKYEYESGLLHFYKANGEKVATFRSFDYIKKLPKAGDTTGATP